MPDPLYDQTEFEASLSEILSILSVLEISMTEYINFNAPMKYRDSVDLDRAFRSFRRIWESYAYLPDDRHLIDDCEELIYELSTRVRRNKFTKLEEIKGFEKLRRNLQAVIQRVIMMSYDSPKYRDLVKFGNPNQVPIIANELAKIRLAELAKQLDDFRTVHPDTSRISALETKKYITQLTDDLFNKVPHEQCNDQTKNRTSEILPELLEAFALKIGHSSPSQMHRNAMFFIHKHRQLSFLFIDTMKIHPLQCQQNRY